MYWYANIMVVIYQRVWQTRSRICCIELCSTGIIGSSYLKVFVFFCVQADFISVFLLLFLVIKSLCSLGSPTSSMLNNCPSYYNFILAKSCITPAIFCSSKIYIISLLSPVFLACFEEISKRRRSRSSFGSFQYRYLNVGLCRWLTCRTSTN